MNCTVVMRLIGCAALLLALASCDGGSRSASMMVPTVTANLHVPTVQEKAYLTPTPGSIYLGAHVSSNGASSPAAFAALESSIGRKLALNMHYYGWTQAFPAGDEADDLLNGRIPVVSWNCGASNARVAAGSQDTIIDARAQAIKAYGNVIFLRYMWEMNLAPSANNRARCYDSATDANNGFFSPTQFVAAWRHIRQRFAADGVSNVVWLWNPSAGGQPAAPYYPGDLQVDWVGLDNYDWNTGTFAQVFANMYAQLSPLNKPLLIAETAAKPDMQVRFLSAAVSTLKASFPQVAGFIYFDSAGPMADWRLTPQSSASFAAMARDPYMSARL